MTGNSTEEKVRQSALESLKPILKAYMKSGITGAAEKTAEIEKIAVDKITNNSQDPKVREEAAKTIQPFFKAYKESGLSGLTTEINKRKKQ